MDGRGGARCWIYSNEIVGDSVQPGRHMQGEVL